MDHTEAMLAKMEKLARSYVPEWRFDRRSPDAGSALAMLLSGMLADSAARFDTVLHKHRVQYLNLFDRFKVEPVEAAGSYVRFTAVAAGEAPVHVPAGTQLFAHSDAAEVPVLFETTHGLTISGARLAAMVATDGSRHRIVERMPYSEDAGPESEACDFTMFTTDGDNLERHMLLLGFGDLPVYARGLDLLLDISVDEPEALDETLALLCSDAVRFALRGTEADAEALVWFDSAERDGDAVRLRLADCAPVKTTLDDAACYVLAVVAEGLPELRLIGARLRFSGAGLAPEVVRQGGVVQSPARFRPFGVPLSVYAECDIESRAAFERAGAVVTMTFGLDYEEFEQQAAEVVVDEEYRMVMRRPRAVARQEAVDVHCDEVLAEYLSATGWRPLPMEQGVERLFDGTRRGQQTLRFTAPADLLPYEAASGQPRVRFRLLRADGLYQIPSVQVCPVVEGLTLAYSYEGTPLPLAAAATDNNHEWHSVLGYFEKGREVTAFYSRELAMPALYLGFDANPWGSPASLYLNVENNADVPVDFSVEYLAENGFTRIKVGDDTGGLLYSGALLMVIPQDIERRALFGHTLYWLRLVSYSPGIPDYNLPRIHGLYTNMARVVNRVSMTEEFYLDNPETSHVITLGEQNLTEARVYVNEAGSAAAAAPADGTAVDDAEWVADQTGRENWVLWQVGPPHHPGRFYQIDLATGEIFFAKNVFSTYPARVDGPTVRVVYRSYHGSVANVPAGAINTLNQSIRGIAEVENPIPAFGGHDGYSEETSAAIIGNMLRTRGRAVTTQDYFDIISQVSYGVRQIKCVGGIDIPGEPRPDAITIAILIDEYQKGGHIFSAVKQAVYKALTERSAVVPLGKTLLLTQPKFVRMHARLWLECDRMENAYDLQRQCAESIGRFLDPLAGGFEGEGWRIGVLPTVQQLVAYLKLRHPGMVVERIVMTADYESREYAVDEHLREHITSPFAMAINGSHVVHVGLAAFEG